MSAVYKFLLKSFESSTIIFVFAGIGLIIGNFSAEITFMIAPIGVLYISLLKMCVIPILVSVISTSVGKLLALKGISKLLPKVLIFSLLGMFFASFIGVAIGYGSNIIQHNYIDDNQSSAVSDELLLSIGQIVHDNQGGELKMALHTIEEPEPVTSILSNIFTLLVPDNIFSALSDGNTLQILFFAIVLGIALGFIPKENSSNLIHLFEGINKVFTKIIRGFIFLLPFGLCSLIAANVSQVGEAALAAMFVLAPQVLLAMVVLFIVSSIIIGSRTEGFFSSLTAFKPTIITAIGTANSMVCLPSALEVMQKKLNFDEERVNLLLPFIVSLCRFGPIAYFALTAIFVMNIYDAPLSASNLTIVFFGAVVAGMASAGTSGVTTLTLLSVVLSQLQLPIEAVLMLFIVMDPIIAPFRVLAIVHVSCAIVAWVLPKPNTNNAAEDENKPSLMPDVEPIKAA